MTINTQPTARELRLFSMLWTPLFCLLAAGSLHFRRHLTLAAFAVLIIAAAALLVGAVRPSAMRRPFVALSWATFPLGWIMTRVVLGLVYGALVVPLGLLMRLSGRDPMARRFERDRRSYWAQRDGRAAEVRRYFQTW